MNCPYCNQEMVQGFIQCRDGVTWTPREQPVAALSFLAKGSIRLANGAAHDNRTVYAHNCPRCSRVIIDYSPAEP